MIQFLKWIAIGIAFAIGFVLAVTFTVPVFIISVVVVFVWGGYKLVMWMFK